MGKLLIAIFLLITVQARSQISDSLPADPCPPDTTEPQIKVYPIPTAGKFTIDMGNCAEINNTVLLFDIIGRLVAIYNAPASVINLNLSYLARGVYYIRIMNEKRSVVRGILLQ